MKRFLLFTSFSVGLLFSNLINAQVSAYTFSQSTGSYTPITGGTNLTAAVATTSLDAEVYTALPIGFTFNYNGTDFTTFGINVNGWISMGSTAPLSTSIPIGGTTTNVISAASADLLGRQFVTASSTLGSPTITVTSGSLLGISVGDVIFGTGVPTGATVLSISGSTITMSANGITSTGTGRNIRFGNGSVRYQTIGTAPNRQLVVQWSKFSRNATNAPSDFLNFQIILNETNNKVNTVYNFPYVNTAYTMQVGLRGVATTDFNNRATTTSWSATTAGTTNTTTCSVSTTIIPAIGQTFTWTPSTCGAPGGLVASAITSATATLGWNTSATATGGYDWELRASGVCGSGTPTQSGTSATTTVNLTGLSANTTYTYCVRATCAGPINSGWSSSTFTTSCVAITSLPWNENFDSMASIGTGIVPSCWLNVTGTSAWASHNAATTTHNAPRSSANYMAIPFSNTTASNLWSPGFILTAGTSYDFSFYYNTSGNTSSFIGFTGNVFVNTIQSSTGATNVGTFITATQGTGSTADVTAYAKYTVTYVPATTGTFYFDLNVSSTVSPWYLGVDDFNLQISPSCLPPTLTATTVITDTTATINWNAATPTPINGYKYEIRTSGVAESGATGLTSSGSVGAGILTANVTALTGATSYSIYVQSDCGASTSAWTSAGTFVTACPVPNNPGAISITLPNAAGFTLNYAPASPVPTGYILFFSTGTTATAVPTLVTGTTYVNSTAYTFGGNSYTCITNTSVSPILLLGGVSNTQFNYFLFSKSTTNNCFGTPYYSTGVSVSPTTCPAPATLPVNSLVTTTSATVSWTASVLGGNAGAITYTLGVYSDPSRTILVGSLYAMGASITQALSGLTPGTSYYYTITASNGSCTTSTTGSFATACLPASYTTTDGTRCGTGTVVLSGTPSSGNMAWYAALTGGSALATTNTFTTPSITATTTYYAESQISGANVNGGRLVSAGTTSYNDGTTGLVFDVTTSFTLNSVSVYNTAAGTLIITLVNSAGTVLQTSPSFSVPFVNTSTAFVANLGWSIPVGIGYRLICATGSTTGVFIRESSLGGFPYSLSSNGAITGGYFAGASTSYYQFYNWNMSSVCASTPRTAVIATVTPATSITTSGNVAICSGSSTTLTVSSANVGYTYNWSPASGLSATTGASITANPTTTTTYTITASDVSGCNITATLIVTINPVPTSVTVLPSTTNVCTETITPLVASGGSLSGTGTIGTDTVVNGTTSFPNPFSGFYGGAKNQMIYLASELSGQGLTAGSSISTLGLNISAFVAKACTDLTIRMKNSNLTALTGIETGTTTVYGPVTYTPTAIGWNSFTLATPFIWDGASNIIVEFVHNAGNGGNGSGTTVNCSTTTGNKTFYVAKDNVAGSISGFDAATFTITGGSTSRPNVRFNYGFVAPITWSPTAGLYTDALATSTYTGTPATTVYHKGVANTYTATATLGTCTKTAMSVIALNPKPTLASVTATSACENTQSTVTMAGLLPNTAGSFTYTNSYIPGPVFSLSGTSDASGNFSFVTPNLPIVANGAIITITGSTVTATGCTTAFTGKTVTVVVKPNTSITTQPVSQAICLGSPVTFSVGAANSATGYLYEWRKNNVIIPLATNATFTIATVTAADAGSYTVVVVGECGAAVTSSAAVLTVNPLITPTFAIISSLCKGSFYAFPNTSINGIVGTWAPAFDNLNSGSYTFTPTTGQCATVAVFAITITPQTVPTFVTIPAQCSGTSLVLPTTSTNSISGSWAPAFDTLNSATYTFTPTTGQCATTATLVVTITPSSTVSTPVTACDGYTWVNSGLTYNTSGTYTGTTTNCVAQELVLTITPSSTLSTPITACDSYTWANTGLTYNTSGTYTGTTTNCVAQELVLTITPSSTLSTPITACDSYTWANSGLTYTTSGTYTGTTTNCVAQELVLTITPSSTLSTPITACDTYTWANTGLTYTTSGTYAGTTTNCVAQELVLTITPSSTVSTSVTACDTYTWANSGLAYTTSGTYAGTTTNCVAQELVLTITPSSTVSTSVTACDTYTWANSGLAYTTSGTYIGTTTNCVTQKLVLTITSSSINNTNVTACQSYTWANNSVTYTNSGVYFGSTSNCVSEQLTLTINPLTIPTFDAVATLCAGDSYVLPTTSTNSITGTWFPAFDNSGSDIYTFTPTTGQCAATATLPIIIGGTTTWSGTVWTNGTPTSTSTAIISGNYSEPANLDACTLTVISNAVVTIPSGTNVTLQGAITVSSGSFTLNNNANLLQSRNVVNSGNIIVKRETSLVKRLDYVLWSSPVASQNLLAFSPLTTVTPTPRFYTYNPTTNSYNSIAPSSNSFAKGAGYLIRIRNNQSALVASSWTGTFTGVPNNGPVSLSVVNNTFNALGNPYPSTISADNFITANGLTGALYFWKKDNNLFQVATPTSSYATYTLAGGVGTMANTLGGSNLIPNGVIEVGQGFIAKATSTSFNFTNAMRIANNGNQFFRTTEDRSRVWINLTNTDGLFSQALLAYLPNATSGIDAAIDGRLFNDSDGGSSFSSLIDNQEFAVQGRALPFETTDVVPMAFKAATTGNYTIAIDHTDGLFIATGQAVYLKDNLLATTTDLAIPYTFASNAGVFNNRFEIVYQPAGTLATVIPTLNDTSVIVYKQNENIVINTGKIAMANVKIFDIRGRLLIEKSNINATDIKINTPAANQILIVKITSNNNETVIKKVIN